MQPTSPISIVYFGTPAYAVPTLRALAADARFDVRTVVTQPDRPAGRGHALLPSTVKQAALELDLPILQPETLRDEDARKELRALDADLFVVAAYGLIFSRAILTIPRYGCVNLHASLLPSYRGAAPIPAAILSGDDMTGITLMVMERGLDTGPILATATLPIGRTATTESLTTELAEMGAELTTMALPHYLAGQIGPVPQPAGATAVRQLTKADGQIDWTQPALHIERHVRAMWAWPRAWSILGPGGPALQIHVASVESLRTGHEPGSVLIDAGAILVGTGHGMLRIDRAQMPGGKPVSGSDLVRAGTIGNSVRFEPATPPEVPLIRPA